MKPDASEPLCGHLHIFVAFDWGDEVDLGRAAQLAPGEGVFVSLSRPRTPSSITVQTTTAAFSARAVKLPLPGCGDGLIENVEATIFEFAAVSVSLELRFRLWLRN